jgi:shikimate kinase/3-dehydroquinate synthase
MGAGKSRLGDQVARRLGRPFLDLDREIERASGRSIPEIFRADGEAAFRVVESEAAVQELRKPEPAVIALGGGAIETEAILAGLRDRAVTALIEIDVDEAWRRVGGKGRPLASDEPSFRALHERRLPVYREAADAVIEDADDAVLAAAGISLGGPVTLSGPAEVVADENVLGLHDTPVEATVHAVAAGEQAKTLAQAEVLWRELRLDRTGTLVAFGGGSTTDLGGYVAASYMRGIDWVAVPTSLVGQVDAAIGGKTAVDLPEGKNLVGAFHWPARTVIDPGYLATLPDAERASGMAEVVKTGLLAGEPLWELPETELVRRCAAFKAAICIRDPHDHAERRTLNLGHTFAHALEAGSGYELRHGEAVALGLLAALRLSSRPTDVVDEVLAPKPVKADRHRAWEALLRDKKGRLNLVLLGDDGGFVTEVPEADVRRALDELIAD